MNKIMVFFHESIITIPLVFSGLLLIVFGSFLYISNIGNRDYIRIVATVSNVSINQDDYTDSEGNHIKTTYEVSVKYTIDGKKYEGTIAGVPKYKKGDRIKIFYNPRNPNEITKSKSLISPPIVCLVGICSLVFGIISGIKSVKKCDFESQ